ncbi:hypothetical protein P378_15520 [Desulforamulus profundi]|uniref:Uncharacterized protein n=1 Tax=Desulforamulus profundi TaxID=1383067 RepID=A0A2C6MEB7_9FIRM|nr:hypothetical protein [Desulforamulus profundi]PHJ37656.1 hypothetical protein P378_15520 [Desulforamulus profundi]
MLDLTNYKNRILSDDDIPLFEDAVKAASNNALRAAYVMIWLACAESLKRRFREAQKRDSTAGRIVGQIEQREVEHKSVDKFVLEQARVYGFLSDSAHTILTHVYDMRCLYGHPYEEAPSEEQVSHAAAVVVEYVLSQPVKLREGFGGQLLKNLLEDPNYLDDQRDTVEQFAKEILMKIDEKIYIWFLEKYWKGLEQIADDSTMKVFFFRGVWFTQAFLKQIGVDILSHDQWHGQVSKFPKTLIRVLSDSELYSKIGQRAQDYLLGNILDESDSRPSLLRILEDLLISKVLTNRQKDRFQEKIESIKSTKLYASGVSMTRCVGRIIEDLKSHNWYTQNPAINFILSNDPEQVAKLFTDEQCVLGRNILQCAEGNASSAINMLEVISESDKKWPIDFVKGIVLECFTNEQNQIRFKKEHLSKTLDILAGLDTDVQKSIIDVVTNSIECGIPKYHWLDKDDFDSVIEIISNYKWAIELQECLKSKASTLPEREEGA